MGASSFVGALDSTTVCVCPEACSGGALESAIEEDGWTDIDIVKKNCDSGEINRKRGFWGFLGRSAVALNKRCGESLGIDYEL